MREMRFKLSLAKWVLFTLPMTAVLSLALIFPGCSDHWSVSDSGSADDGVSFFEQPYFEDALAKRSDIQSSTTHYSEAFLTVKDGGVVPLGDNADNEAFVVLPFSYVADTTFTVQVTKIVTNDGETPIVYEFGPDGLQFSRPAVLRLNAFELFGKNTRSVNFYWHNETTNEWELQESQEPAEDGTVWFSVGHFSQFGCGADGAVK